MFLVHYNHNHDRLGRFTGSNSSSQSTMATYGKYKRKNASSKEQYKAGKKLYKDYLHSNEQSNGFKPKRNTQNRETVASDARNALSKDKKYNSAKIEYQKSLKKYDQSVDNMDRFLENLDSKKSVDGLPVDEYINSKTYRKYEKDIRDSEKALDRNAEKFIKERNRVTDKFLANYADATIKDLELSNTDEVKDYIIRNSVDNWSDEYLPGSYTSFLYDKTSRQKEKYRRTHAK